MAYKRLGIFAAPMILMAAGAALTTGCDDGSNPVTGASEEICGPCGDVKLGDVSISGNAELDGFFKAVSTLNDATMRATADFELGLTNLEAVWGLEGKGNLSARVDDLVAAVKADFGGSGSAKASLVVDVTPAQCTANIDVAVQAQANCEAKADCDVDVEAPSAEVTCSGSCTGTCEGSCAADVTATCEVKGPSVECSGTCEGTCELSAAAKCEGTCHGDCSGTCSVENADGSCAGSCDGECEGSCEVAAGAKCDGTCSGSCIVEAPEAGCEGDASLRCEGKCEGSCTGGCEGEVKPGKASADCDASAKCEAQASAQASGSMDCTPPTLDYHVEFDGNIDASAQAELIGKLGALRINGSMMIQSFTKLQALINGKVDGEVVFDPSPVESVAASLSAVLDAGADGSLIKDLPAGRIGCAIPALEAAGSMIGDITSEGAAAVEAEAKFAAAVSTGFKS